MLQLIICIETNKKAKTDQFYIDKTIKDIYKLDNNIKISYVYFDSKTKYNDRNTIKAIKDNVNSNKGNNEVLYCIDLDNYDTNTDDQNRNKTIDDYCKQHNYEFVWFCKTIEEVYVGKVTDSNKIKEAKKYASHGDVRKAKLNSNTYNLNTSNLLIVIDKYLDRK